MWFIQHKRDPSRRVTGAGTYHAALCAFYRQWRDPDGSIPWTLEYEA